VDRRPPSAREPGPRLEGAQSLGGALASIVERFAGHGVLGVVVVDATPLAAVERSYRYEIYARTLHNLIELIRQAAADCLEASDCVVAGETGRHEVVLLLFRRRDAAGELLRQLSAATSALADAFATQGQRIVYPFLKKLPFFAIGSAAALHNGTLGTPSQLRQAIEEARRDAELASRLAARRERRLLHQLVLGQRVSSVYEPIVDVAQKTVFGYEALARGPAGSEFHSPMAMFEAAEREGLLFELDCLCRRSGLEGALGLPAGTKLFLNARPTAIHDPSFHPDAIQRTLERSQLRPSDIVFEISEQESIHNFSLFREVRDYYGNLGFQIALDDTGAGYASLQAVMELSPEYIKVDRALVSGVDTDGARQELLRALHSVSHRIGARIIAEGLDSLEELETLRELEIPFGQGWLFGKPTPLRAA
jgi:EAL domain-containing protein (putative c-di-GMP-specific phosphodiesterase class I)